MIKRVIGGKTDDKDILPESILIDTILQRYHWTISEFNVEYELYPEYFGELMVIMSEQGKKSKTQSKHGERRMKDHEMQERRKRLGVI